MYAHRRAAGFPHPLPLAPIPSLKHNSWLSALAVLDVGKYNEKIYAFFYKSPGDVVGDALAQKGVAQWNNTAQQFVPIVLWPLQLNT
jgi:hypothetical protein